jgi:hypothetical protein
MAATVEASRLTEAHRQAQLRLGRTVVAQMLAVWPLIDPADIEATSARWLSVVLSFLATHRRASASIASQYLTVFRALELGIDVPPADPVIANTLDLPVASAVILAAGPVALQKALQRSVPLVRAVDVAKAGAAGAAMSQALNGGRETITGTVEADPLALGWARATSADPCAFCRVLASRGPVYKTEASAKFKTSATTSESYHPTCHCTAEPVYRRDADWPAGAREFRRQWNETTVGLHGRDALNAYRRSLTH